MERSIGFDVTDFAVSLSDDWPEIGGLNALCAKSRALPDRVPRASCPDTLGDHQP